MNDDCGQDGPCATAPGCARHWAERNRELLEEIARLRAELARMRGEADLRASDLAGLARRTQG